MKTMTATELKTNPSEFFDALLSDGGVTITRNGKDFPLKLVREEKEKMGINETSDKLTAAMIAVIESIPDEKREEAAEGMTKAIEEHRAEVRERRAEARLRRKLKGNG